MVQKSQSKMEETRTQPDSGPARKLPPFERFHVRRFGRVLPGKLHVQQLGQQVRRWAVERAERRCNQPVNFARGRSFRGLRRGWPPQQRGRKRQSHDLNHGRTRSHRPRFDHRFRGSRRRMPLQPGRRFQFRSHVPPQLDDVIVRRHFAQLPASQSQTAFELDRCGGGQHGDQPVPDIPADGRKRWRQGPDQDVSQLPVRIRTLTCFDSKKKIYVNAKFEKKRM